MAVLKIRLSFRKVVENWSCYRRDDSFFHFFWCISRDLFAHDQSWLVTRFFVFFLTGVSGAPVLNDEWIPVWCLLSLSLRRYRALVWRYRALLRRYRALLCRYRALLWRYRALLWRYRASLYRYRALLWRYRALLWRYRALLCEIWFCMYRDRDVYELTMCMSLI